MEVLMTFKEVKTMSESLKNANELYKILEDIKCDNCPLEYTCKDTSISICTILKNWEGGIY